ncbi:MAG: thioredoxin [Gammaproteobacteria bacterium]|nr:thioredoxin [Gammaproteobacteria bacterium]MDH3507505.1 thioredoxin [Gammaproteobacteria bacterium]
MSAIQPVTLTDATFETEVVQSDQPVLVDFWAPWCGPCHTVAPVIEALAEEYDGKAKIAKLNVDDNPQISQRFNVRSIPTLMVFKGGELVETAVGARPKAQLEQLLDQYI